MPGVSQPANEVVAYGKPPRTTWKAVTAAIEIGRLVKVSSATEVTKTGAANTNTFGVADWDKRKKATDSYAVGEELPVAHWAAGNVYKVVAGGAIAVGALVEPGADGKVVTFVAPAVATDTEAEALGVALQAAALNDEVLVMAR